LKTASYTVAAAQFFKPVGTKESTFTPTELSREHNSQESNSWTSGTCSTDSVTLSDDDDDSSILSLLDYDPFDVLTTSPDDLTG